MAAKSVRIAVNGAYGRMGTRILSIAAASKEFQVAGAFEHAKSGQIGKDLALGEGRTVKIEKLSLKGKGVLIDFSSPAGTPAALEAAKKAGWGLVVGTTGLDAPTHEALRAASKKIPVVLSSNMSVGVNLLLTLVAQAAKSLGKDYDIEITEAHHRHKKDAPSGTALMLAASVASAKGWDLNRVLRYRSAGKSEAERGHEEIGMQVIRSGEIVGDHTVLFAGPSEVIEITHRAQSRDAFARGALTAAAFLSNKTKGFYSMQDVLK